MNTYDTLPLSDTEFDCPDCSGTGQEWHGRFDNRHACERCGGAGLIPMTDLTTDEAELITERATA